LVTVNSKIKKNIREIIPDKITSIDHMPDGFGNGGVGKGFGLGPGNGLGTGSGLTSAKGFRR
jgi:hypothetical protein